jgi:serine/threonine protein kinase
MNLTVEPVTGPPSHLNAPVGAAKTTVTIAGHTFTLLVQPYQVAVPAGVSPGEKFTVQLPDGREPEVECPPGVGPGGYVMVPAELGSGGQAKVFLGESNTGKRVAVKVFFAKAVNAAPRELQFLQALQTHDNVVKCLGDAQIAGPLPPALSLSGIVSPSGIVMDHAEGGDFMGYLLDTLDIHENPMHPAAARSYFLQMLDGLKHVHGRGVVVCDLKPDNMLLLDESCRQLLLADFGHAAQRDHLPVEPSGTLAFEAPEVKLRGVTRDTADKIDVWSLGVCLCILVMGINPFQGARSVVLNELKEAQANQRNGVRAACRPCRAGEGRPLWDEEARFDALPADLAALLDGMLQYDAARRLTLDEVAARSGPWTAAPAVAEATAVALMAEVVPAASRSRTQLQPPSPDRTRSYHERADPQTAPAAGPTASYRSMAAAQDDEAPMPRSLGASYRGLSASDEAEAPVPHGLGGLGAADAEPPRYNACGALGASYRSAMDMAPPPAAPLGPMPKLKRMNARSRPVA